MVKENSEIYDFGPFTLTPAEKQLTRDGSLIPLTPKAFDLLVVLVENAGHLLKKGELMNLVWPDSFVEEANLPVKISELRRALDYGPDGAPLIETVPRQGYRFLGEVRVRSTVDTGIAPRLAVTEEENADGATGPRPRRSRFAVAAWAGIAVLAVIALSLGLNAGGMRERLLAHNAPSPINSLAVLPLENLSGDSSQEYVADGMTEALITDLAKIGDLRVISRASVMQYKAVGRPLGDLARELNVDVVLTGSVVRSGDRVRISVLLVDAPGEQNLWAESYERDLKDVIALQNAVTRDVVARIRSKLATPDTSAEAAAPIVNPVAYDNYLRGKFHLYRQTRSDNETAIAALEQAVAADPAFAAAHAELAQAYVWKLFLFDPAGERKWAEKAYLASEKAIAMDPNLAVAYLARGRLLWTPANRFPHEKAIQEYRKAVSLDPNLDEARNQLALVYNHIGAFDEALRELEAAVQTNPGNSLARFRIGQTLAFQGKHEEAFNSLRNVPEQTNPALVGHQIVWALFNLGRKAEAEATMNQFVGDYPDENRALLESIKAVMAASDGRVSDAEQHLASAVRLGRGYGHFHHTTYYVAISYALLDRPKDAMKWLEITADTGFPCYPLFEKDPNLNKLRGNPEFEDFLTRMRGQWEIYRAAISS